MHADPYVPPLQRDALLAMLRVPSHTLVRRAGAFTPLAANATTSGTHAVQQFTMRLVRMLDRGGLVTLDDPDFPDSVTLNPEGRQLAEQLDALHQRPNAKAVRA